MCTFDNKLVAFSCRNALPLHFPFIIISNIFFFFLIGKEISLRANRLEKGYTRSIPKTLKQKTKGQNKLDPYLVAS